MNRKSKLSTTFKAAKAETGDYTTMSVKDLKEEYKKRGLHVSGLLILPPFLFLALFHFLFHHRCCLLWPPTPLFASDITTTVRRQWCVAITIATTTITMAATIITIVRRELARYALLLLLLSIYGSAHSGIMRSLHYLSSPKARGNNIRIHNL